jgi:hypothetical protein
LQRHGATHPFHELISIRRDNDYHQENDTDDEIFVVLQALSAQPLAIEFQALPVSDSGVGGGKCRAGSGKMLVHHAPAKTYVCSIAE